MSLDTVTLSWEGKLNPAPLAQWDPPTPHTRLQGRRALRGRGGGGVGPGLELTALPASGSGENPLFAHRSPHPPHPGISRFRIGRK